MYTQSIYTRSSHNPLRTRTPWPSKPDSRGTIEQDLMVADMIARAIEDNASQLYRGA